MKLQLWKARRVGATAGAILLGVPLSLGIMYLLTDYTGLIGSPGSSPILWLSVATPLILGAFAGAFLATLWWRQKQGPDRD